jgi:SpoVK/Ycf46/Vps4 family AAA+-type ATPase
MAETTMNNYKVSEKSSLYSNSLEYLLDELKCLDMMIHLRMVKENHKKTVNSLEDFKGLILSEEEILGLVTGCQSQFSEKGLSNHENKDIRLLEEALEQMGSQIQKRRTASLKNGIYLSLPCLSQLFRLTSFEEKCLLISLASEIDLKYEKIYAYLQDDVTKKYPTLHLIFKLLTEKLEEIAFAKQYFSTQAPLIRWQFLKFIGDQREIPVTSLSRPINIDERIVNFLLENNILDSATSEILNFVQKKEGIDSLYLNKDLKDKLKNLTMHLKEVKESVSNTVVSFYGSAGVGKKRAAAAISGSLNIPLLEVNTRLLLKNEDSFFETLDRIIREAVLLQCCLLFKDFDLLLSEEGKISYFRRYLIKEVSTFSWLTFLTGEKNWESKGEIESEKVRYIKIHFPIPDFKLRKKIWEKALNGRNNFMTDLTPDLLAEKFKFTEGQIRAAIATAIDRTFFHPFEKNVITDEDLLIGCRQQNNQKLSELSLKITPKFSWQDIVLPDDQIAQLREICNHLKYRHIVYGEWGFEKKVSGKGLNVLFSGPSGTGKTMAAEILASELKLELYKIDLSQVVSKYIGETEKNLNRIFTEAQTSNTILFFDEADALFGKRSEVKDAHDRYANIEIGYLLQKMEEYEGMTILATNLRQNMDEAFVRRMQFIVDFPFPDERHRELIWRKIFPEIAPISKDLDYRFLAEKLRLAGGNIKNIALNSAFYAADRTSAIGMGHIMLATKREYQKTGKPFLKTDFEPYYELVGEK